MRMSSVMGMGRLAVITEPLLHAGDFVLIRSARRLIEGLAP
jgi:hypothetical protein